MTWREITLGEFFTVKHGYAFKGEYFSESGEYVVLTPGNFNEGGGFRARPGKDRFYSVEPPEEFVLSPGDLIVAMTEQGPGLLGSSALVPQEGCYLHNQRIGLVENLDTTRLNRLYLYHLFNTREVRGQIRASATGGKVRHTAPKRIQAVRVRAPDVSAQERIAGAASIYDELIENNKKRTALLEEAARLLYREWVGYLRYPGHQHVKITNGVPDGWARRTLGEIATIRKGRNITRDSSESGDIPVIAGGLQPAYFHSTANAIGPVITVSASGANAGFVGLHFRDIWASDCSYLSIAENHVLWFLYLSMKARQTDITNMQQGAAQPHVYPKDLERLSILVPHASLLSQLDEYLAENFRLIANLEQQARKLTEARDLLLPRLMSGELAA